MFIIIMSLKTYCSVKNSELPTMDETSKMRLHLYKIYCLFPYLYNKTLCSYLYINLACLSVWVFGCLSVCLYPINVKTAELIGFKFFVGYHVTTGKVYE